MAHRHISTIQGDFLVPKIKNAYSSFTETSMMYTLGSVPLVFKMILKTIIYQTKYKMAEFK